MRTYSCYVHVCVVHKQNYICSRTILCSQILERLSSIAPEVHIVRDTCQVKPDAVCMYMYIRTYSGRVQILTCIIISVGLLPCS